MSKIFLCLMLCVSLLLATPRDAAKVLSQPDSKIDLARACLILAKDAYPDFNIDAAITQIDILARNTQNLVELLPDTMPLARKRISALNTTLFVPGAWNRVDSTTSSIYVFDSTIGESQDQKAMFLPYLLKEGRGTYPMLAALWYAIADRLNWPVAIVQMPYLQRYIKYMDKVGINVDPSVLGRSVDDTTYVRLYGLTPTALRSQIYMRLLTKKEFLSSVLCSSAYYSAAVLGDDGAAAAYFKLAIRYDARNAEALAGLGLLTKNSDLVRKAQMLGLIAGKKKASP